MCKICKKALFIEKFITQKKKTFLNWLKFWGKIVNCMYFELAKLLECHEFFWLSYIHFSAIFWNCPSFFDSMFLQFPGFALHGNPIRSQFCLRDSIQREILHWKYIFGYFFYVIRRFKWKISKNDDNNSQNTLQQKCKIP